MIKRTKLEFNAPIEYNNATIKDFLKSYCKISTQLMINLKKEYKGICINQQHKTVIENIKYKDKVTLTLPIDRNEITPIQMTLDIKYEDEHLIIINKPSNMPVHPTSCGHYNDTLANGVSYYMREKEEMYTIRAINRLDKDTTGLVIIAKNSYSAYTLGTNVDKTYLAISEGEILKSGTIDIGISREEGRSIQRVADINGQRAITYYSPLEYKDGYTLTEVKLETGRTHQIRVHMSYRGTPLAGDDMYGGNQNMIKRQALHCSKLKFIHPISKELIELKAEIPKDMDIFKFKTLK